MVGVGADSFTFRADYDDIVRQKSFCTALSVKCCTKARQGILALDLATQALDIHHRCIPLTDVPQAGGQLSAHILKHGETGLSPGR